MNISPTPRNLSIWLFAAILGAVLTLAPASASIDPEAINPNKSVTSLEGASLPLLEGAAPDVSVMSASQCPSGSFCVWSAEDYQGTMKRFTTQSQYTSLNISSVQSFYNNRSGRVYIYGNSSGTPSACYGPRAKRDNTSSSNWLYLAKGTYLSTATSC